MQKDNVEKYVRITLTTNKEYVILEEESDTVKVNQITDNKIEWIKLQELNRDKNLILIKAEAVVLIEQMDKGLIGRQTKIFKLVENNII